MADPSEFTLNKGKALTAVRRDTRMTANARLVGWEYLAWWSEKRPNGPIFDLSDAYFFETLGCSPATTWVARVQLQRFEHFWFMRTGRAVLAWPWSIAPEQRSLNFEDQILKNPGGRSSKFEDRKKQNNQDKQEERARSLSSVDLPGGQHGRRKASGSAGAHEFLDRAIGELDADGEGSPLGQSAPRAVSKG